MREKQLTGYPSIDKPWLKYHNPNVYDTPMPQKTAYEYLWENNREHLENVALEYYGRKIIYKELFANIRPLAKIKK